MEELMDILVALKEEEAKLEKQLKGTQGAIIALNGSHLSGSTSSGKSVRPRRTMSAAARAAISRATKARWAKFRADKAKKAK
jgi:hypothetical protein